MDEPGIYRVLPRDREFRRNPDADVYEYVTIRGDLPRTLTHNHCALYPMIFLPLHLYDDKKRLDRYCRRYNTIVFCDIDCKRHVK